MPRVLLAARSRRASPITCSALGLLILYAGCVTPELPIQLSLRYRFQDDLRSGTRAYLEKEHRIELLTELRPASRAGLSTSRAFGAFAPCDGCDEEIVERLYDEWLLRHGGEGDGMDEEPISRDEFERMLEDGELEQEIELLMEELLERDSTDSGELEEIEETEEIEELDEVEEIEPRAGYNLGEADKGFERRERA